MFLSSVAVDLSFALMQSELHSSGAAGAGWEQV